MIKMKDNGNAPKMTRQVSEKLSIVKRWISRHARDQQQFSQLSLLLEKSKGKRKRTQSLDVHDLEPDDVPLLLWNNVNNHFSKSFSGYS